MQHITVRSEFYIAYWNRMLLGSSFKKKFSEPKRCTWQGPGLAATYPL